MKILLIGFSVGGVMGDGLKVLADYFSREDEVIFITNEKLNIRPHANLKVYQFKFDKDHFSDFINIKTYRRLSKTIKSVDYDVAFIYNGHPANWFISKIIDKNRTIAYLHDPRYHSGKRPLKVRMAKIFRVDYRKYAKIIVSSHEMKKVCLEARNITNPDQVEVVYLGGIENLFFDLPKVEEDIDVMFFGWILSYKGLDTLIESAKKLPEMKFLIAGEGSLSKATGIKSLPENCTRIDEYIPDKELATLINRSKIIALPYRDATGTQTVQIASYYKKPVIATRTGCFPEYVRDQTDGIIVSPNNPEELTAAIKTLVASEDMRREMGKNANSRLDNIFSNSLICQQYKRIFEQLAK